MKRFKQGNLDVVLMDIQMPELDGYQATAEIRAWEKVNDKAPVWIFAVTANSFDEDRKRIMSSGFDGHITKPFTKATLFEPFANITRKSREID